MIIKENLFLVKNPEALTTYIRWISTVVQSASARPKSQEKNLIDSVSNVDVPRPPELIQSVNDIW